MNQNQDPNILQNVGDFAMDAAVDTPVDGLVNQGVDMVAQHIPGGQMVDQMLKTETDQVVNNAINAELNKGVGGMLNDVEGLFGHRG
jgi:hypothetical protein